MCKGYNCSGQCFPVAPKMESPAESCSDAADKVSLTCTVTETSGKGLHCFPRCFSVCYVFFYQAVSSVDAFF